MHSALRRVRREPTARRPPEELADLSPAELRSVLGGVLGHPQAAVSVCDPTSHRFVVVNDAFAQLVGRSPTEIVGCTCHDVLSHEMAERRVASNRRTIAAGVPTTIAERVIDAAGNARDLTTRVFPVLGCTGQVAAVGAVSVDVTEREAEHRQAFDSETRFRTVFEHADIGQIYSTPDGVVTLVNTPMARMLGYETSDMIGRLTHDFMPECEHPAILATAAALQSEEASSWTAVRRFLHRDGHEVNVALTSALLRREDGTPSMWVTMTRDVTEHERAAEELVRAHAAAVAAADRLRVVHAIAVSANEAAALDELGACVVEQVCEYFGWQGGALLHWPAAGSGDAGQVLYAREAPWAQTVAQVLGPPASEAVADVAVDRSPGQLVVVPLAGSARTAGQMAWVFDADGAVLDEGEREMLVMVGIDSSRVVDREAAARLRRESELHFRSVFDSSPLAMGLTLGETGSYGEVNNALCELVGRTREELLGTSARALCHPDDVELTDPAGAAAAAAPDGRHQFELRLVHSSGAIVNTIVTLTWIVQTDGPRQLLAQMEDVTARRTAEELLRRQAEHDDLTGLVNRSGLSRVLGDLAQSAARCAVFFIDLDGFKLINDTRGHDVGDEVLQIVAARLRQAVRPGDVVARFGGDEFVVVCAQRGPGNGLLHGHQVADRIEAALRSPIETSRGPAHVTASIGLADGRVSVANTHQLLQRADAAMYEAKRLGKDRRARYDDELHRATTARRRTESALRNAIDDDRFVLHYQPIKSLDGVLTVGYEALVRLVAEDGSLVPPDQFIAVAEQSGLIIPMGAWVLRESCRTISRLRAQTGAPLQVSVNIAARQAARPDLADTVFDALESAGLPADSLVLEVTESALLEADTGTLKQLVWLRENGIKIALDDFGTGYSSLTYLRRLPVTALKIDRSFVSGIVESSGDLAIVRAVTRLADDLDLRWVAEGVETAEQRDMLLDLGPGSGQGYFFGRPAPMPPSD